MTTKKVLKRPATRTVHARKHKLPPRNQRHVRAFVLGSYNATVAAMHAEVQEMKDVLLGKKEPPINNGLLTLMEVSDAYFARASEMTMRILELEREGTVTKNSNAYKFRTGELRVFMEMAKRAAELGSRRITFEQARVEAERTGRSSSFDDMYRDQP